MTTPSKVAVEKPEAVEVAEPKAPNAKRVATEAKAKREPTSKFVFYVSSDVENAPFPLKIGDHRIRGSWDDARHYVTWKVPTELAELADKHHHVWCGRILRCKD